MGFLKLFNGKKPVIGMIHLMAMPGTPASGASVEEIITAARKEALLYKECGLDGIMIENMNDVPYLNREVGPEVVSAMAMAAREVRTVFDGPIGIQVLAGANKAAISIAHASGLNFIRAEGFVFSHVADEGNMDSDAGELLRFRKMIGAESVMVLTDIKKKHSAHALTSDVSLAETASAAEFFLSDGLIVTGASTGNAPSVDQIREARSGSSLPVLVGSGVNAENAADLYNESDGLIIGSAFKEEGDWKNKILKSRVEEILSTLK